MKTFERITFDSDVMAGKPCIKGTRVTVGLIVSLIAQGQTAQQILESYPYLKNDDVKAALDYAAWRVEEKELPLVA